MAEQDKDPFYVGYLPLPRAIKRFIVPWLVGNIILLAGIAAVVASNHREPGDGRWDTGKAVTISGWMQTEPYPVLHAADGRAYILVEQGKTGVQDRVSRFGPGEHEVAATGFLIEREGRRVLELDGAAPSPIVLLLRTKEQLDADADRALATGDFSRITRRRETTDLGTHTLRGEIVDPKCYLGVMQPGDGKTHKACATLCITGGIPPMFVVSDAKGVTAAYLLTDAQGNAFPASHYEYIADPVELSGQVLRDGDLLVLRADLDSIRRLGPGD